MRLFSLGISPVSTEIFVLPADTDITGRNSEQQPAKRKCCWWWWWSWWWWWCGGVYCIFSSVTTPLAPLYRARSLSLFSNSALELKGGPGKYFFAVGKSHARIPNKPTQNQAEPHSPALQYSDTQIKVVSRAILISLLLPHTTHC